MPCEPNPGASHLEPDMLTGHVMCCRSDGRRGQSGLGGSGAKSVPRLFRSVLEPLVHDMWRALQFCWI